MQDSAGEMALEGKGGVLVPSEVSALESGFADRRAHKAEVFWSKRRHRRQVSRIADLLPERGTFIDVGAYLGNIAAHVRGAKPCQAILFEPVIGHYEFCCQRFAGEDDVVVENLALSDTAGEASIHRGHKNLAWNTMLHAMANRRNTLLPPQPVRCVRFDDYARDKHQEPLLCDGNGRTVRLVDDNGNATLYLYDTLDRETQRVLPDNSRRTYAYNPASDVTRMIDENGSQFDYTYDAIGRKTACDIQLAEGVVGTTGQVFEYDGLSRVTLTRDEVNAVEADVEMYYGRKKVPDTFSASFLLP